MITAKAEAQQSHNSLAVVKSIGPDNYISKYDQDHTTVECWCFVHFLLFILNLFGLGNTILVFMVRWLSVVKQSRTNILFSLCLCAVCKFFCFYWIIANIVILCKRKILINYLSA